MTKERWSDLHREAYALWAELEAAGEAGAAGKAAARKKFAALCDEYRAGTPRVAVARCPCASEEVRHSVDTLGLAGLWWRYRHPIRPVETGLCPHFLVLTGAARVPKVVPRAPHLVRPGPEVPFVIPRLLKLPGVTAVIRGLRVGGEPSWAISYFAKKPKPAWALANTWGSEQSPRSTAEVSLSEDDDLGDVEWDADLRPWLRDGRLLWIREGDDALELQRGEEGCPYLGLEGRRDVVRLQNGEQW